MNQRQRLKFSILITAVVLVVMIGLGLLQSHGYLSEDMYKYLAIGVAIIVVILNGVLRRKTRV